jgi:hypothetical protein
VFGFSDLFLLKLFTAEINRAKFAAPSALLKQKAAISIIHSLPAIYNFSAIGHSSRNVTEANMALSCLLGNTERVLHHVTHDSACLRHTVVGIPFVWQRLYMFRRSPRITLNVFRSAVLALFSRDALQHYPRTHLQSSPVRSCSILPKGKFGPVLDPIYMIDGGWSGRGGGGAGGTIAVKALCYKPEGRGFGNQ